MTIEITAQPDAPADADVLAVAVHADRTVPDGTPAELDVSFLEAAGFEGKLGEALAVPAEGGGAVLAVGVGAPGEATVDTYRRAAAVAVRSAKGAVRLALALTAGRPAHLDALAVDQAVAEGAVLGAYRYTAWKSEPNGQKLQALSFVGADADAIERGRRVGEAVALARDLVNAPPVEMTPIRLAEVATEIAAREGLQVDIWDEDRIEAEGLGGLRGVSLGSEQPPRLIRLAYEPPNARATVAIVGKGITFDSGGLSIKTGEGMMTMKTDMSGAAAVIAAMSAVAAVTDGVRVIAYAACTENMPSGSAIKPGDVLRARNGTTIEVLNTDAEGRLVLADALSLAVEDQPDAIVDLATLTGACVVALGREIGGLMGTDDALVARVEQAAERAGEPMWHLPLPQQYRKHIDSDVADIKNIGATGQAGTLAAGLFLREFVADVPWAHLDIAGPARAEADDAYISKGGTGVGVRTLLELLADYGRA